jgi:glucose/arabinose dehydrogenase
MMKNLIKNCLFFVFSSLWAAPEPVLNFKVAQESFKVEKLTDGHGIIWGMDFLTKDLLLFTEKNGQISVLDLKKETVRNLKNLPKVYDSGQGGLLDIAVDPNFSQNSFVYVTYSKRIENKQTTAMARARLDLKKEEFDQWEDLFIAKPTLSTTHHYGSRIAFDPKGYIFLSVGERGSANLAQSLEAHMGKIIRLKMDGSIPQDNPFYNNPKALKEIWSYGHRNPQGLFFDKKSNILYEQEHGPMGGDEINIIKKGLNYGWPVITYGVDYSGKPIGKGETHSEGMEQPIKYFKPSIAPSSLLVYRNGMLGFFNDKFVSAALALQHMNAVAIKDSLKACEDRFLEKLNERFRDVIQGPDGYLYISSDNGRIYRIKENNL